jgi:L-rhamnose isomerase
MSKIERRYEETKERLMELGVDTEKALNVLRNIPISIHCWQGDDVRGFDTDCSISGGIQVTGNYCGRARNFEELTRDISKVLSLVPGENKINIHASYRNTLSGHDRDSMSEDDFKEWIDFATEKGIGLDFNPTFFAHPLSDDKGTLSSSDKNIREFWINHGIQSRRIAQAIGKKTGKTCINNIWIPDGQKEFPIDSMGPRMRLMESLDIIFEESIDRTYSKDSVECKLFGIGSESYVVGSHEFYLAYVLSRKEKGIVLTLDMGHFHPTELISSKLSALLLFNPELQVHVSRPVRWDSDHVVIQDDETNNIMAELVRLNALDKVYLALDYFDGSINRIQAWVIGARSAKKSLLRALLQPVTLLKEKEIKGEFGSRLALLEEWKSIPFEDVWNYFCECEGMPSDCSWINETEKYGHYLCNTR